MLISTSTLCPILTFQTLVPLVELHFSAGRKNDRPVVKMTGWSNFHSLWPRHQIAKPTSYLVSTGCEMAEYVFDPTKIFPFIARDELDEKWKGLRDLFMRTWVSNHRPSNRRWRNAATQAGPITRFHSTKDDNYVDLVRICYCFIVFFVCFDYCFCFA
jgi:hypothetical protein